MLVLHLRAGVVPSLLLALALSPAPSFAPQTGGPKPVPVVQPVAEPKPRPAVKQKNRETKAVFRGTAALDAVIEDAIRADEIPGAVLIVGHKNKIVHRKAYGFRALQPRREPMTLDTVFDVASLTKSAATAPAIMKLFEQGKVRLNDRVTRYLPEFQQGDITVRDLMTHFSGLRPSLDLQPRWSGYEAGIKLALKEKPTSPPGTRFTYSDINYILLSEIVRRVSGQDLARYVAENIYNPLGMKDTGFHPPASLLPRIAPTELVGGKMLRGVVHDPTSRLMGGVAGHAGLFSTADDLARFAEMMLSEGRLGSVRLFSAATVHKFTTPQSPADQPILRGLGWDIDSPYSGNRGELFPIGSYGHTGFTGTSLWIDSVSQTYVILLANNVHPKTRPAITPLRARVGTVVAAALDITAPGINITGYNETLTGPGLHRIVARNAEVLTGLDVLRAENFAPFAGKRIGLITNHTGITRDGRRNVDVMVEAGVRISSLLSPEHGISGQQDEETIMDTYDPATNLRIWSLYDPKTRRPSEEMLRDVDILVFDIQDVGARFYTYITTMAYAMEEAAKRNIPFFVLDRPNPITGTHVEGPILDRDALSFIGYYPIPVRHGMTIGELARFFNAQNNIGADLRVIQMQNWQRGDWFDSTGLAWIDPSPNIRGLNAALLYPGVAMLEFSTNYSVGRGTDAPFEQVGADWISGPELAGYLNSRYIPGIRTYPVRFRPASSNFSGKMIEGVRFVITNREAFDSSRLGLELAAALQKLYPGKLNLDINLRLIGSRELIAQLARGEDPRALHEAVEESLRRFVQLREEYLLYR